MVDWNSEHWGEAGHNVHESSTGSWLPSAHGEEQQP